LRFGGRQAAGLSAQGAKGIWNNDWDAAWAAAAATPTNPFRPMPPWWTSSALLFRLRFPRGIPPVGAGFISATNRCWWRLAAFFKGLSAGRDRLGICSGAEPGSASLCAFEGPAGPGVIRPWWPMGDCFPTNPIPPPASARHQPLLKAPWGLEPPPVAYLGDNRC